MTFLRFTTAVVALALITVSIAGAAGLGAAAVTDMANEEVVFEDESNLTVSVDWMDDASSDSTADVTVYGEDAYQIDGDDVTDSHLNATTLNGTVAEFDTGNVSNATTFDVDLDSSKPVSTATEFHHVALPQR